MTPQGNGMQSFSAPCASENQLLQYALISRNALANHENEAFNAAAR